MPASPAHRHHLNGSTPGNGQSAFAARIAAYLDAISLPHPDYGPLPPPVPRRSVRDRITDRLRREEREREQLELAIQCDGRFPPNTKGVG